VLWRDIENQQDLKTMCVNIRFIYFETTKRREELCAVETTHTIEAKGAGDDTHYFCTNNYRFVACFIKSSSQFKQKIARLYSITKERMTVRIFGSKVQIEKSRLLLTNNSLTQNIM
jgi:hypothetical protein